jgi:hypothetical protein
MLSTGSTPAVAVSGRPAGIPVLRMRRRLAQVAVVGFVAAFMLFAVASVATGTLTLIVGIAALAALVAGGGSSLAWMLLPDYADEAHRTSQIRSVLPYVVRASAYAVGAAGAAVLVVDMLPRSLSASIETEIDGLTLSGFAALIFATFGASLGILEEWRRSAGATVPVALPVSEPTAAVRKELPPIERDGTLTQLDRWTLTGSIAIAIVLIGASVVRPEMSGTFFSGLGGLATLVALYFVFAR